MKLNCHRVLSLVIFILYILLLPVSAVAQPRINGQAAVLMDLDSGRVLYAMNVHQRLPQASTTKITTAILAIKGGDLDRKVHISVGAAATGESSMGLRNGEVLRLRDLLYGMLLLSGNDAAVATAEAVAGSEKEFVKMMNDYAAEVGAEDTHYTNPHGLHSPDHYSSAYDLALLAREGFKLPEFRRIIALPEAEVKRQSRTQLMKNINRLLTGDEEYYSFANGVKSGYTTPAGNCLVSSAAKNGWTLVAVVLNARDVYGESKKLLEWGFNTFNRTPVLQPGKFIRDIKVEGGRKDLVAVVTGGTLSVPLLDGEKKELEQRVVLPDTVTAPVEEGEWLGEIRLFMDDTRVATVDLVAGSTVKRRSLLTSIWQSLIAILTFH